MPPLNEAALRQAQGESGRTAPLHNAEKLSSFAQAAQAGADTSEAMAWLSAIVRDSDDAIIGNNLDGIIVAWNPAAERMYGWKESEAAGKHVTMIMPPEQMHDCEEVMTRIRAGMPIKHRETVRMHRSGERIHVSISVSPVKDRTGAIIGASTVALGITQEKRLRALLVETERKASEDLHTSHEQLEVILQHITDGVTIQEASGNILYANEKAARLCGFSSVQEFLSVPANDVVARFELMDERGEKISLTKLPGRQALQGLNPPGMLIRFCVIDTGEERVSNVRASPVLDEHGKVIFVINVFQDVTEATFAEEKVRKLNEELEQRVAMRTSELYIANRKLRAEIIERQRIEEQDRANLKRLSHIIDSMPMGAIVTDEQLKVLHLNEHFCRLFKLGAPHTLMQKSGQEIMELVKEHLLQPETYEQGLFEILGKQQPVLGSELRMRDGRVILCDYMPIFVLDMHRGHILLYRDVTQERRTDAAKSEFMSLASHQLRTPLTAIRWSLSKLSKSMKHKATDLEYNILLEGHHEAVRMAETIDTMLAISQIESGKVRLRKATVALKPCLTTTLDQFKDEYSSRHQVITVDCAEGMEIPADPKVLKEILTNLLSNAVKYTPAHGTISMTARKEGAHISIAVTDTGYGIPAHQQHQIFDKFFRCDNILHKETDGTGLGLYLVSLLVQLLSGTISFTSREGEGTTFLVSFPLSPL
ncbi:PAS domain S-box protein [Candidatus Peregrinibacteria bacterium]|nr:PAS domain S-box protein [Candidatus Peregrinibacteria bacterium]